MRILSMLLFVLLIIAPHSLVVWEHGYLAFGRLSEEVEQVENKVKKLRERIINVNADIDEWENGGFVVEKALREDLLMAKPNEFVIYLMK